jgi:hypothetical protein
MNQLTITDAFWTRYRQLIRHEMIPYQWNVLHDKEKISIEKERDEDFIPSEKSHAIENFKIAAGRSKGHHYGWLFQDSDVYKWLESAANAYALKPDNNLKDMMDEVIELIEEAQDEDGYLSTFYQIEAPQLKFRRLFESHELYCAGHLIEAAVAHYKATGERRLIKVSEKFITCIEQHFGEEEGKIQGADGHQEIELALVKLYEITHEKRYLELSHWFLMIRGQDPEFYDKQLKENKRQGLDDREPVHINKVYHQAHKPVVDQDEAVGHAVRLVYMAAAMAEIAHYQEDKKLLEAAQKIWGNIVKKRMYITGGIGSTVHGEAFTFDYDLPNDTMYCETCAAIGLMFFAHAMMKNGVHVEYANIIERCLYNSVISGMGLDGKRFFYVNPLEVDPTASKKDPAKSHVKATRPSWFGCACCPPNLARTLTSLEQYLYSVQDETIYVHLFIESEGIVQASDNVVPIKQTVQLLDSGVVNINIDTKKESMKVALRVPEWAENFEIQKDGESCIFRQENGYAVVEVIGETNLTLTFDMPIIEMQSHPKLKQNKGKVALQRGPFVYCLEEIDNSANLHLISLIGKTSTHIKEDPILGTFTEIIGQGEIIEPVGWENVLYQPYRPPKVKKMELRFIPYYLWANRAVGEMRIWIDKK